MSARYTSAALSRRLRDAGLEHPPKATGTYATFAVWDTDGGLFERTNICLPEQSRALRLDEVLEELRRERTGGPLALDVSLNVHPMITTIESEAVGVHPTYARHAVPVEAAGLVLAQLLEARRG